MRRRMRHLGFAIVIAGSWPALRAQAVPAASTPAAQATPAPQTVEITVAADKAWTDSGIDLQAGERCRFEADGSVTFSQQVSSPNGLARGWRDVIRVLPLNSAGRGTLIAKIGDAPLPFVLGSTGEFAAATTGRLLVGVNQASTEPGQGSYHLRLEITRGATSAPAGATATQFELPDAADVLAKIPRRVGDNAGNPGDMINFFVLGPEERLLDAFRAAGWVVTDRTKTTAVLHGLMSTLSKQAYLELPMSDLYLFGRPQDYGLAHADPLQVVASRHHLRLWKAPFAVRGGELWVGAATHDIGLDRDQRNGGVTHKIDPNVDDEREYVRTSLLSTGLIAAEGAVTPPDAVREARTATGAAFHSDGRVLVFRLAAAAAAKDARTSQ